MMSFNPDVKLNIKAELRYQIGKKNSSTKGHINPFYLFMFLLPLKPVLYETEQINHSEI